MIIKNIRFSYLPRVLPALFGLVFFAIGLVDGFSLMPIIMMTIFSLLSLILLTLKLNFFKYENGLYLFTPIGGGGMIIPESEIDKVTSYKEINVKNGISSNIVLNVKLKLIPNHEVRRMAFISDWFRNVVKDERDNVTEFEYVCVFSVISLCNNHDI